MSFADNPYQATSWNYAADAAVDERVDFVRKTYLHLGGAILSFAAIEAALLNMPGLGEKVLSGLSSVPYSWAIVLGAFMLVSYLAESWARSTVSKSTQYLGLSLYVVAEAAIFFPLLYMANRFDAKIIPTAGLATLTIFGGLTAIVFFTRADFSFLRTALWLGGLIAMGFCLASIFIGFSLGLVFSVAMVALAGGYILYDTSNVLHHYRIGQHVAASLALFASVALMFWYVVRIIMALSSRD
ncbi:MAG TPA: Bax inhibitor-1 family protein [Pirellulales bacterium]|nr:Bax inhibitor-1 family protein [Pirellulales bacterium]